MSNFFDLPEDPVEQKDVRQLIEELSVNCRACRLGQTFDRHNTGFLSAGSVESRIAILGDMPGPESVSSRCPVAGPNLKALEEWLARVHITLRDVFIVNAVQCRTSKSRAKDEVPRPPFPEESDICFPQRALQVLRAMPRLQVVITLGWTAAGVLVGRNPEPRMKTHEGSWFGTDYLPGVAVFCLDHPREYLVKDKDQAKRIGRLHQCLEFFEKEYLNPGSGKIMKILAIREQERHQHV